MSGEIKGIPGTSQPMPTSTTSAREAKTSPASAAGVSGKRVGEIVLSDIAVSLQKLDDYIRQLPTADEAKIIAIREDIAGGLYQVDGMRVAVKFLGFEVPYHQPAANDGFHAIA